MSDPQEKIVLFGCGGHSRSVADILLANNQNVSLVFIDPNARKNETIYGFPVIKEYSKCDNPIFFAIGDNIGRKNKMEELGHVNNLISIVSRMAHIGHDVHLSLGCFVGNFSHIGPNAYIGKNTIINTAAIVEHEVTIGEHCHIGPNATISGRCKIGGLVFVGVGAIIKDYIKVCSNVTVGAGATVVKDITEAGVYVGSPALRIK